MKIHFDNVDTSSSSGPNTFGSRLIHGMLELGHTIVDNYKNSDVSCVFIENRNNIPKEHPIIQRLDGIWFKPSEFISKNSLIKKTYMESNQIVWQSNFDKEMITHHWGTRPGKVIHNGISLKNIEVQNQELINFRQNYDLIFTASANWHRQKRLKENIELFLKIKNSLKEKCALIVMGSNPDFSSQDPDIFYTGSLSHEMCLEVFSSADWMIHLAWLDHCPNTVVEALSQNCSVICTDSGGTHEIVRENGVVIKETAEYNFELADYDRPYGLSLDNFDVSKLFEKKTFDNSYLQIEKVAKMYEKVFMSALGEID